MYVCGLGYSGYKEVNLALSSSWSANYKHRVSDSQQLLQLGHLKEEKHCIKLDLWSYKHH